MYAATVDGRPLTFEVSAVWRRNMIVRDRETGTLWQHATGEGLIGPLRGNRLVPLGGEQMTWAAWQAEHPASVVAIGQDRWPGLLPQPVVEHMLVTATNAEGLKLPGLHSMDKRLPQFKMVAGVTVAGESKAYPLTLLKKQGIINDEVGSVPIAVLYESTLDRVRVFKREVMERPVLLNLIEGTLRGSPEGWIWDRAGNPLHGTPSPLAKVPVSRQRWLGWSEFHPGSSIYDDI